MTRLSWVVRMLVSVAPALAQSFPQALEGTWRVTSALTDSGASRTVQYRNDDPRLKGRSVTFSTATIATDLPEDKRCVKPAVAAQRTTAGALIQATLATRSAGKAATAEDYHLGVASGASVDALWVSCSEGTMGPNGRNRGTWMVVLPDKRLAMRWYDETILLLTRLPENTRPDPSFACAKASALVEKTICGSVSLAAFDRSVAESYAAASKRFLDDDDKDALKTLRAGQREWLAKRNACGPKAACVQNAMENRLEALSRIR